MKRAIEEAIKKGLKPSDVFSIYKEEKRIKREFIEGDLRVNITGTIDVLFYIKHTVLEDNSEWYDYQDTSIYHLLFGTLFIKYLLGRNQYVCLSCNEAYEENLTICRRCLGISVRNAANYHRSKMANLKDVEELKKYVGKLI